MLGFTTLADGSLADSPAASGSSGAYTLTCNAGAITLAGQSATLLKTKLLNGSAGSLALAGQNATLTKSKLLIGSAGSLTLAGQSATLLKGSLLNASTGSFALAGQDATLTKTAAGAFTLTCLAGSFTLDGQSATLEKAGTPATAPAGGGIGHGGKKKKAVYVERDGKILLFKNNADAALYVAAEKAQQAEEIPLEQPKRATSKPVVQKKAPEPQVINVEALKAYFQAVQQYEELKRVEEYLRQQEFDLLLQIQLSVNLANWQEEDDIEILLLATI